MIKEVEVFKRQNIFDRYHKCTNPFVFCTVKLDVTNVVNYCKKNRNFYGTLGFLVTKTANEIDAFKYRYKGGKIFYCDEVRSNYTQMFEDETIGYFTLPASNNYSDYIHNFVNTQNKFMEEKKFEESSELDEIWLSCVPWFSFEGLVPIFDKESPVPQFVWDKYKKENDQYYLNLMMMIHHGFADGSHLGKFVDLLNKNISDFK